MRGAWQVAHNAADGTGDADGKDHQPAHEVSKEAGIVAGQVEHLAVAVGGAQVKLHQAGKGDDGKGARAGPHQTIIQADAKPDAQRQRRFFQIHGAVIPVFVREVALPQDDDRRNGQDDEHGGLQNLIAEQQDNVRPQRAARKAADGRQNAHLDVHGTIFEEAGRGKGGAAGSTELIGGIGVVRRQPCKQIGRQADEPAAARRGIHKPCKSGHKDKKHHHDRGNCNTHCYNSFL